MNSEVKFKDLFPNHFAEINNLARGDNSIYLLSAEQISSQKKRSKSVKLQTTEK